MPRVSKKSAAASATTPAPAKSSTPVPSGPMATIGNTKVFANIMKLFASTVQDGNIIFRENGLYISGMDQSHVCLLRCEMSTDTMMYKAPDNDVSVGVSFGVLNKILSACSSARCTTLIPSIDGGKMEIRVDTDKGENRFAIVPMEVDEDDMVIPEIDYDVIRTMEYSSLKDAIDQADKLGANSVIIARTRKNEIRMSYKTDILEGDVLVSEGGDDSSENAIHIATPYLKNFISSGPFGPQIKISYSGNDVPLCTRCYLVGISGELSESDFVEIHIAPRVDDEEEVGEDLENVREY